MKTHTEKMERPLEEILSLRSSGIQLQSATDYRGYRHRATKQLARSRRKLKIQVRPTKGSKKSGKPKEVSSEELTDDPQYGDVLVYSAERSWAHAMEGKAIIETNTGSLSSKKKHVVSKLAKAYKYTRQLVDALDTGETSFYSANTKLELYGYHALVEGALRFEQHNWQKTIKAYSIARVVLDIFQQQSEFMKDAISATVDPALSFAIYQSERSRSADIPTLAKETVSKLDQPVVNLIKEVDAAALEYSTSSLNPSARLGEISWRGHSAKVGDPDLASCIIAAKENDDQLEKSGKKKVTAFDDVLQGWQEALDMVRENIEEIEASPEKASVHDTNTQQQYIILTYISYNLLFRRIERDMLLINDLQSGTAKTVKKKLEQNRDIIRIYDTILQSASQLVNLPGVNQDDDLFSSLETMDLYFKIKRTSLVALSYGVSGDRLTSLALFNHAQKQYATNITSIAVDLPNALVTQANVTAATEQLQQDISRAHGLAVLAKESEDQTDKNSTNAVADSLLRYPKGTPETVLKNLVNFTPALKPAPVKPAYFDIAFNFIDYNGEDRAAVQQSEEQPAAQKKSGGFLGSLLGRR
jgi:signal recognition particle subunit SRP68